MLNCRGVNVVILLSSKLYLRSKAYFSIVILNWSVDRLQVGLSLWSHSWFYLFSVNKVGICGLKYGTIIVYPTQKYLSFIIINSCGKFFLSVCFLHFWYCFQLTIPLWKKIVFTKSILSQYKFSSNVNGLLIR